MYPIAKDFCSPSRSAGRSIAGLCDCRGDNESGRKDEQAGMRSDRDRRRPQSVAKLPPAQPTARTQCEAGNETGAESGMNCGRTCCNICPPPDRVSRDRFDLTSRRSAAHARQGAELGAPQGRWSTQPSNSLQYYRRGAGVAERGGLEIRCALRGTVGSNPTLSAIYSI